VRYLILVALLAGACGDPADTRVDLCTGTPCTEPQGTCYDLDAEGRAYCVNGEWRDVLDGRSCGQADGASATCRAERGNTHKGEPRACHYGILSC
jgi:hypothetical protein